MKTKKRLESETVAIDNDHRDLNEILNQINDDLGIASSGVIFLESLAGSLDDKFIAMNAQSKLERRQLEINELKTVSLAFN